MTRILGFNEAWDDRSTSKYIDPVVMADYWKIVQEVAYEMDLTMVSPTYSGHLEHIEWFAEFLNACYLRRDDDSPCTVEDIEILATHEYQCIESHWTDTYTPNTGSIMTDLIETLDKLADENGYEYDWESWVLDRDYMVTEVNCSWDKYPDYLPDYETYCARITGQDPQDNYEKYGVGAI